MPDPKRLRILTVLVGRLESIRASDGFFTDVGLNLYVGEAPMLGPDDPDEAAALTIGVESVSWQQQKLFITWPIYAVGG